MYHSIVVAKGEQEVKQAVRDFQSAGRGVDQIQILAHENVRTEEMFKPKYTSRIGFVGEAMAHTVAPLYKCEGMALREKLLSLGLSMSAVEYYEKEMASGRIVIAVDENDILNQ
ncbi:general stress protein [Paenibacillus oleatilyticus]|uniref:General stress protein n=1 Tax=Paenibacillus oleatilyticus TaxID=2594886 RepID=A0ABV4V1P0_9BACL|nr:general stress protein [Paenibacillus oleatilyticus]MBU7315447.1 general stress protein [Paenibacillus oleatilyticus]